MDGTFLALAGLNRLNLSDKVSFGKMKIDEWMPAPAQGAVGITAREMDEKIYRYLAPLHHKETSYACLAERGFLKGLDGSCRTPIAAYATIKDGFVHMEGLIIRPNGSMTIRKEGSDIVENAEELGLKLASHIKSMIGDVDQFLKG